MSSIFLTMDLLGNPITARWVVDWGVSSSRRSWLDLCICPSSSFVELLAVGLDHHDLTLSSLLNSTTNAKYGMPIHQLQNKTPFSHAKDPPYSCSCATLSFSAYVIFQGFLVLTSFMIFVLSKIVSLHHVSIRNTKYATECQHAFCLARDELCHYSCPTVSSLRQQCPVMLSVWRLPWLQIPLLLHRVLPK